jgi:hypothetical protein
MLMISFKNYPEFPLDFYMAKGCYDTGIKFEGADYPKGNPAFTKRFRSKHFCEILLCANFGRLMKDHSKGG